MMRQALTAILSSAAAVMIGAFATRAVIIDPPKAPAAVATTAPAAPLKAMTVDGRVVALADAPGVRATALVVMSTQCPISNKYVPELNRLAAQFEKRHGSAARLMGVISDPTVTRAAAAQYVKEYQIAFPVLFDASGELAARLKPTTTPEAIALDARGEVRYRGRIDDLFADLRKQRAEATTHDLADAVGAIVAGKAPAVARTQAVGCVFEAWDAIKAKGGAAAITYARDAAPILNANCVQCHREGQVAPFSLTGYEEAAKHAKQMARVAGERLMPPWKAEPGFGHFVDERRLSDREIELLGRWANAGAPKGDDADLPPAATFAGGWALGEPDMVLTMPKAFMVPAEGRDVYRVFPIPVDLPADKYVVGFEFKAGAASVVHHALFFLDDKGRARELAAANTDGQPGYQSFGGVKFQPSGGLGGWAPGAQPFFQPDGVGRPLRKGSDVVIQVHYHPDGKPHEDRSQLALYFAKKPVHKIALSIPLRNRQIDIPPGESHYVRTATITSPTDVTLLGIIPHMHLVGRQMKVVAHKPDGTDVPLIYVKDWDFRWQDQYRYAEPVHLPAGTRVDLEAIYDNSAANPDNPNTPPKRVTHGEQTTDEMCICFLQLTVDNWDAGEPIGGRLTMLRQLLGGGTSRATTQPGRE